MSLHKEETIRFAVVGAGHMGANHIKKINSIGKKIGARVSVVIEPDELRATALSREFPDFEKPSLLSNVGELQSVDEANFPNAAIIAVPASIHKEATEACLDKGLHCLVEKPLGFSAIDCRELEARAHSRQKVLHAGMLERWSLCHLWSSWRPKKGPWTIHADRSGPFVPRAADTDVIHDLMVHDIDLFVLLNSVFKLAPIVNIRSWGRRLRSDHIDQAIVAIDMEDGGCARFFASRLSAESSRRWEMTGPDWHASLDFMRRSLKRFERVGQDMVAFEAREQSWAGGDPLALEIEAFVNALRGGYGLSPETAQNAFDFCRPSELEPSPANVIKTHELIDKIVSNMRVLEI